MAMDLASLENKVNEAIKRGLSPHGTPFKITYYHQAMVRYETEKSS